MLFIVLGFAFIFFFALLLLLGFFTVEQQTNAIIERFGKFLRTAKPGLGWKIPIIDRTAGRINLRIQQLDVQVETKTKDNVFVRIMVSVQYFASAENVYKAFYSLDDTQLKSPHLCST